MCNATDTSSPPNDEPPMHRYLAELERLPDGSLRISLYRDGRPIHREWARNQRTGRRRIIDLICSAIDTEPRGWAQASSAHTSTGRSRKRPRHLIP
jgi:hypothetical protein